MSSSKLVRWGSISFMLAGAVLVVSRLLIFGQASVGPVLFIPSTIVALLLLAAGMVGLHALQKENYGRIGRAGLYMVLASLAILALYYFIVAVKGQQSLQIVQLLLLAHFLGTVIGIVGFALYGIATWRARVLPRWYAVLFIVYDLLVLAFDNTGSLLDSLFLLVFGSVLWFHRNAATEQPSRVR